MNRVTIELWLWLGKELREDFESPSEMRSIKEEAVEEGTTILQLLNNLAGRYRVLSEEVFDMDKGRLHPHVVLNYNDKVISPYVMHQQVLKNGDRITILPMYMGG